jgi:NAD-specific glutamate dehydrogenase
MKIKQESRAENASTANFRYRSAMGDIAMNNKKKLLFTQLENILQSDRQRKQVNAGIYAKGFAPDYVNVGEKNLAERFNNQFKLAAVNEQQNDKNKGKKIAKREIVNAGTSFLSDSVDSIHFERSKANEIIASRPRYDQTNSFCEESL